MRFKGVNNKVHLYGVGWFRTLSSLLQNSHDTNHVEISLYRDFHPTRFLNTTLSTAEISYNK